MARSVGGTNVFSKVCAAPDPSIKPEDEGYDKPEDGNSV
jgi:hypothetical protein